MNSYIFISAEGYTFQPDTEAIDPDIENCQVIGFANGTNPQNAFENLIKERSYILETTFDELICLQLKHFNHRKHIEYFYLSLPKTQPSRGPI